jgi:hypothetical protein
LIDKAKEDHAQKARAHDNVQSTRTASKQTITITSTLEWVNNEKSFNVDDRSSSQGKDL